MLYSNFLTFNLLKISELYFCHVLKSSCFNYLVLAANKTKINQDGVLGFHGTPQTFPELIKLIAKKQIKNEKQFLKELNIPNDIFNRIVEKREIYTSKHNIEDMNFWMIGKDFFIENNIQLDSTSYFPTNQLQLEDNVREVLKSPELKNDTKLVMYGIFLNGNENKNNN